MTLDRILVRPKRTAVLFFSLPWVEGAADRLPLRFAGRLVPSALVR
jgi:hypothetical protein